MDVPEIRHRVGLLLGQKDRVACSLVCKAWCDIFTPLLYDTVDLWTARMRRGVRWGANFPSMALLRGHSHHIRQLNLYEKEYDSNEYVASDFQDLDHDVNSPGYYPSNYAWLQDFLTNNTNIERLRLRGLQDYEMLSRLMGSFLALKELHLNEMMFDTSDIAFILMNCKKLRALTIADGQQCNAYDGWPADMPELFPNIKFLDLRRTYGPSLGFFLKLVARCPSLEELRIEEPTSHKEYTDPDFTLLKRCPKLVRLEIRTLRLVDGELGEFLNSCSELTHLTLRGVRFNEKAHKALKRHFPTLKVLNFFDAIGSKGWMCGHVLTMCPNLVELAWPELDVDALTLSGGVTVEIPNKKRLSMAESAATETNGRPWACKNLKTLKAASIKWSTAEQTNTLFNRMKQFRRLEEFLIGGTDDPFETEDTIARRSMFIDSPRQPRCRAGPFVHGEFDFEQMQGIEILRRLTMIWPRLRRYQYLDKNLF